MHAQSKRSCQYSRLCRAIFVLSGLLSFHAQGFFLERIIGIGFPTTSGRGYKEVSRIRSSLFGLKMASTNPVSVPNWRVMRKTKDGDFPEASVILQERQEWSESSYQDALELYRQLTSCTDSYCTGPIETALNCLDHAYRLYGPESVFCSFNGGKDAVVILHLMRAAHANYYNERGIETGLVRPRAIYFDHNDEFPEVLSFLRENVDVYDLDMIAFEQGVKFPKGLKALVDNNFPKGSEIPFPVAFVLGTRTSDPNAGKQGQFAPSSHYMPPFMRVNPILCWTYGNVWHFLRLFHLPYCSLYDQGYTSLGTTKDTLPCPALAVAGAGGSVPQYWPAYMLRDWDQERAGRITKETKSKQKTTVVVVDESERSISRTSSTVERLSTLSEVRAVGRVETTEVDVSINTVEDTSSCVSYSSDAVTQKTVGILIIGDEILKGFTPDTNTQSAARALRGHNVLLKRVVVVSDDLDEIAKEIDRLQQEVDVIITSGGVGPTHDDVTIKGVASALGCELVLHEEMARLLRDKMNNGDQDAELTDAQTKMATLPRSAKLRNLSDNPKDWPVLQCQNIFILPGVPEFFAKKIEDVANYLSCQLARSMAYKVVLSVDENSIVPALNQVVENHPNVSIGSYPFVSHPEFKTVITVEGRLLSGGRNSMIWDPNMIEQSKDTMNQHVQRALHELITMLPNDSVLRVDNDDTICFS